MTSHVIPNEDRPPAVLVVEDEHHVCELIADILESEKLEVACARTDTEAIDLLRGDQAYGCVILDVNLRHGLTGFDVARFARGVTPKVPILFVSGEATRDSFEANGVPGSDFLAKPFTAKELLSRVGDVIRRAPQRGDPPA